ncbi:endothelin-converting enzyme homolog [Drosophila serrata]|uniref:endothelin-converting enzyme homolog n=1 Tax=Drosophila serrata TaxID=7274 RepID=UPI000A1D066D|nr:endothelin-converting enzyme homolog [Drosophila serrata]
MRSSRSADWSALLTLLLSGIQFFVVTGVRPKNKPGYREELIVRQQMSSDMQKYMNLSADPCTDFFEFACGNWGAYHSLYSAQELMENRILEQLQQLLTEPLPPQHHPNGYSGQSLSNVRKVRAFYESCVAVEGNASERRRFLMKILQDNGGLRNVENSNWQHNRQWLQTLAELRRKYGLDILLGLEIDQSQQGNSISFGEPKLTIIPVEHCNAFVTHGDRVKEEIYEQVQEQVAENMQNWFAMDAGEAFRFGGDIVRFEFELCKGMRVEDIQEPMDESPRALPLYGSRSRTAQIQLNRRKNGMTLAELTNEMGNLLDFKLFVEIILENQYLGAVYLRSSEYIKHLIRTVKSNNHITLSWYIIYVALNELNQPPEEPPLHRPRQCVQVIEQLFPHVLGEMFQRHVQRDNAKHDLDAIFSDIIKAFEQQMHAEWLDERDRRAARTRLSQYRFLLPDYKNLDLSDLQFYKRQDYWSRLETVLKYRSDQQFEKLRESDNDQDLNDLLDAFEVRTSLASHKQAVLVGWGLLQSPYYHYHYPKALKYALLGQRLASSLVQAFVDNGWNQWNELTMDGYRNVSECHRAQYSNYLYNEPREFRSVTRLREIIAESSGLNIAFKAYLEWLEQQDYSLGPLLEKETLPQLNFSNTQLFFIYFAQSQCWAKDNQEAILDSMPLMQHTPERWNVNGPLSNSVEFGREFGCALGTPMNNGDKCLVY